MGNHHSSVHTNNVTVTSTREKKITGDGIFLWKAVPKEVKNLILSKFELPQLMQLARVCKDWNSDIHEGLSRVILREKQRFVRPTLCLISSANFS